MACRIPCLLALAACGSEPALPDRTCTGSGGTLNIGSDESFAEHATCTTVDGRLRFGDTSLVTIDGLDAIHTITDQLVLFRNMNLIAIDGLTRLETIGGDAIIHFHPELADLGGLARLATVGGELYLAFNDQVAGLDGLAAVREVGALTISDNGALASLAALGSMTINGDLLIEGNPLLPQADAETFAARCTVAGTVTIRDNGP